MFIRRYNKYSNHKTFVDNISFASKKEASRYAQLKLLEKAGEITNLQLQPQFVLQEGFRYEGKKERAIVYIADFQYNDHKEKNIVIEDVKGARTEVFLLKRKLFLYKYPYYTFREI